MVTKMQLIRQGSRKRRAVAAVELAVCLPILVLIMLCAIECSNIIFLRQALVQASYEAARLASRPGATSTEATTRAEAVLAARNIGGYSINVNPSNVALLPRGNDILVTVTAPMDANSMVPVAPFSGQALSVTMTSVKN